MTTGAPLTPGAQPTSATAISWSRLSDDGGSNCDSTSGSRNHTISLDRIQATVFYHTDDLRRRLEPDEPDRRCDDAAGFLGHDHEPGRGDAQRRHLRARSTTTARAPSSTTRTTTRTPTTSTRSRCRSAARTGRSGSTTHRSAPATGAASTAPATAGSTGTRTARSAPSTRLYDTKNTQDTSDDTLVWSSNNLFAESKGYSDNDLYESGTPRISKSARPAIRRQLRRPTRAPIPTRSATRA